jgi:hypothetical protein
VYLQLDYRHGSAVLSFQVGNIGGTTYLLR